MNKRIGLEEARNWLVGLWFGGAGLIVMIMVIESIRGRFEDPTGNTPSEVQAIYSWFVPTLFPTLALMLGVISGMAMQTQTDQRSVKMFFFNLSRALSAFYLFVLFVTIAAEPYAQAHGLKYFTTSNYWLIPIQTVAMVAITALFTSQEKTPPGASSSSSSPAPQV